MRKYIAAALPLACCLLPSFSPREPQISAFVFPICSPSPSPLPSSPSDIPRIRLSTALLGQFRCEMMHRQASNVVIGVD